MTLSTVPESHQLLQPSSTKGTVATSGWTLAPGHAMTLRVRHASVLMVVSGRVWATGDGPHAVAARGLGDWVGEAGAQLRLEPGQRVVVESLRGPQGGQACVALRRQAHPYGVLVRDALAVLRGAALGALRGALAGARAAKAASSASRAQGAMACAESMASSGAL